VNDPETGQIDVTGVTLMGKPVGGRLGDGDTGLGILRFTPRPVPGTVQDVPGGVKRDRHRSQMIVHVIVGLGAAVFLLDDLGDGCTVGFNGMAISSLIWFTCILHLKRHF
jgi:hypothetical protein